MELVNILATEQKVTREEIFGQLYSSLHEDIVFFISHDDTRALIRKTDTVEQSDRIDNLQIENETRDNKNGVFRVQTSCNINKDEMKGSTVTFASL